jgi:cytochrome c-type biogenesis protein CcmF
MNEFGHYALFLAWASALFAVCVGLYSGVRGNLGKPGNASWVAVTRNTTIAGAFSGVLSLLTLGYLFHYDDYSNQYVWQYSNKDMASIYKVSAIWGGMDGSMLLWAVFVAICGGMVALRSDRYPRLLVPWVLVGINSSALFFLTVVFFFTNPFRYIKASFIPPDGNGLNPLLQNPFMAIHPPTLYVGFTAHVVPFAFCLAALASGQLSNEWVRLTRRWALFAWMFLTAGIVMGGFWAYVELGWGGFWAWDPVENSSFLPWLTSTAYLHSVMVLERKNMLRLWSVWLMVTTYLLTVFGTFLTRSGIVQSVHAFASTDIGWMFLLYLSVMFVVALGLSIYRRKILISDRKIESFWSREAFFLLNNLVLLSICFATLWGVMFPVLSEAVTGQKQAVGIPFFNAVNVPLFLFLLLLMGVGPMIAWKKATLSSLRKTFLSPFITALFVSGLLVWTGVDQFYPVVSYGLCWFVFMTIMGEMYRALRAQRLAEDKGVVEGVSRLVTRHRSRYGGYLVHLGVVVVTIAITASMAHKYEKEFTLNKGESITVRRYSLTLDSIDGRQTPNYQALHAVVSVRPANGGVGADGVSPAGPLLGVLEPELRSYFRNQETTTEVALLSSWRDDLYIIVSGLDETGARASLKVYVNPLQIWLWIGTMIMVGGTLVLLVPRKSEARSEVLAGDLAASSENRI